MNEWIIKQINKRMGGDIKGNRNPWSNEQLKWTDGKNVGNEVTQKHQIALPLAHWPSLECGAHDFTETHTSAE